MTESLSALGRCRPNRLAPEHKHRLVRALQADGEIVAVAGDGATTVALEALALVSGRCATCWG